MIRKDLSAKGSFSFCPLQSVGRLLLIKRILLLLCGFISNNYWATSDLPTASANPPTVSRVIYIYTRVCVCARVCVGAGAGARGRAKIFKIYNIIGASGRGCRSDPAEPLTVCRVREPFRAFKPWAVKPSKIACIRFEPFHPAENTTEPRKCQEAPKNWAVARCCVAFTRCRCALSLRFLPSVARSRSRLYENIPEKRKAVKSEIWALQGVRKKEKRKPWSLRLILWEDRANNI